MIVMIGTNIVVLMYFVVNYSFFSEVLRECLTYAHVECANINKIYKVRERFWCFSAEKRGKAGGKRTGFGKRVSLSFGKDVGRGNRKMERGR